MKAKPSDATLVWLIRHLRGKYSFCIRDIQNMLECSMRTAQRYFAKMVAADLVIPKYRGTDRCVYYKLRRGKK
jgi:hypothetical protein